MKCVPYQLVNGMHALDCQRLPGLSVLNAPTHQCGRSSWQHCTHSPLACVHDKLTFHYFLDAKQLQSHLAFPDFALPALTGEAKDLHHFRLLQRRFIVYRPKKALAAGQFCSNPTGPSHPSTHSAQPCGLAESAQAGQTVTAEPRASASQSQPLP